MNTVTLAGRLTKDIELRYTPNGVAVANGTMAVQRKFKNAQGEYESDFVDFLAWKKTGELMADYCKKGDYFVINGELQTRMWEKNDGSKQKVTELNVQNFDFPVKPKGGSSQQQNQSRDKDPFANDGTPIDISDDDLPF